VAKVKVVGAALWTPEGKLVMQRRGPDQRNPGMLGLYGVRVEPREAAETALRRELREEMLWRKGREPAYLRARRIGTFALKCDPDPTITIDYTLFSVGVPSEPDFLDLEGAGSELHSWCGVLDRTDLTPAAGLVLTQAKAEFDRI